jgi:hypothetical protein
MVMVMVGVRVRVRVRIRVRVGWVRETDSMHSFAFQNPKTQNQD